MKQVSILLIEDNPLFRLGLAALIEQQEGFVLVATARKPEPALELDRGRTPDVILLDVGSGDREVLDLVRNLRTSHCGIKTIVMGIVPLETEILGFIKEGIRGFILKDASIVDFVDSIRAVAAGQSVLPPTLIEPLFLQVVDDAQRKCSHPMSDVKMTNRELEIVDLIAEGLSNKEIATRLCIATDTVKSHVHNILEKLSLRSRVEVAARARDRASGSN